MKTALITGVTGQDGSYLAEFLLEKGYKVVGLVRRSSATNLSRIHPLLESDLYKNFFSIVEGDLTDFSSLKRALEFAKNRISEQLRTGPESEGP